MKATFGVMAILVMASLCLIPTSQVDASFAEIVEGDRVVEVNESIDLTIIYANNDLPLDSGVSIKYEASLVNSRGEVQSNGISPSSGSLDNGIAKTITVKAPKETGDYTVLVDFVCSEGSGDDEKILDEITDSHRLAVVEPITLTVTLVVSEVSEVDPSGLGVYFVVDDTLIEDSFTTFTVSTKGTATVSYDWIADVSNGEHKFKVIAAEGGITGIEGLGEEHSFYVGEKSYTTYTILVVVLLIIVLIALVWVYRKPVKNYGKPKARR